MLKKLLMIVAALVLSMGTAFAAVDVNKADQAALDGVKGIGPTKAKAILDERSKGGNFKDWADFETRVKGIGEKSAAKLSEAGLTVNGQAMSGVKAAKATPAAASAPAAVAAAPAAVAETAPADVGAKSKKKKSKDAAAK